MNSEESILEYLSKELGLDYLSDLRNLNRQQQKKAVLLIKTNIPAESASLSDWNDTLTYITNRREEESAEAARDKLIKEMNKI